MKNTKGEWYLVSQFILIILHFLQGWPNNTYLNYEIYKYIQILGIIISSKGIINLIIAFHHLGDNLSVLPVPVENSTLITKKSYNKCRHPIYKELIYISLGIFIYKLSLFHLLLLIMLSYILREKAIIEEKKLMVLHSSYKEYLETTPALISYIPYLDWRS